ncbi:hypothetical protein TNCV_2585581 [Trichonephila clavipes]|nr:hypothetical protein TNCV_2585581 [Trichonephila clavipes]
MCDVPFLRNYCSQQHTPYYYDHLGIVVKLLGYGTKGTRFLPTLVTLAKFRNNTKLQGADVVPSIHCKINQNSSNPDDAAQQSRYIT